MTDISLYDYSLPPALIAQEPPERRGDARLMVLRRDREAVEHRYFHEVGAYLRAGDLLVLNDTRVIPARLRARRATGGKVEILLLEEEPQQDGTWRALLRPARSTRKGEALALESTSDAELRILDREGRVFRLEVWRGARRLPAEDVIKLCNAEGEVPLPPYIKRQLGDPRRGDDRRRYQTVYAQRPGAVAAPTAGLHFTLEQLEQLEEAGVQRVTITLHIGFDTFKPLRQADIVSGTLHGERVEISRAVGESLLQARAEGRRIVAVGTTSVRALESFAARGFALPYKERTTLFIRPGHQFQLVDALITNFHLPRSSLLLLVSAFARRERMLAAYGEAVEKGYRFYSYGDAMLIL